VENMMKILFHFGHPAKFHLFRNTINSLIRNGHKVDILINSKDILEELIKDEGWNYVNLFPKGRKIRYLHTYINAAIMSAITIIKLLLFIKGKEYDLFVTSDLLTFVGKLKNIPTLYFADDDFKAVPQQWFLLATSDYVISPAICDLGRYEHKKIGYYGYKALAHLHPNKFILKKELLDSHISEGEDYYFIRLVSTTSIHDIGKGGISNEVLRQIIHLIDGKGKIIISSERNLPKEYEKYLLDYRKKDIGHYIYYAKLFISDSTTMCAEAAMLGTPSIEIDDWYSDFRQFKDLNEKYGLLYAYRPSDIQGVLIKIEELMNNPNVKMEFLEKRNKMLSEKIDVSAFIIWLIENYPKSISTIRENPDYQLKFK
jgi:predicted glycosyltransferase